MGKTSSYYSILNNSCMNKVVVTGANGFVGYWLIKELSKHNIQIKAVIKDKNEDISMFAGMNNVMIVYCDLDNIKELPSKLEERDFDAFYHLAWISAGGAGRADYKVQLLNVKYACDVVGVANELECKKILYAGTITEKIAENILNLESKAQNNIYGVSKHLTHCLVDIECTKYNQDYIWMQFSNLYGPYSINGNIVGYTIKELLLDHEATFGPADQPYDLLYIEDLVYAAYLLGLNKTSKHTYYLGSGKVKKLSEYLLEIGTIMGKKDKIKIGERPDDGTWYDENWFNITQIKIDTDFEPQFSYEESIKKTIRWMETTIKQ